MKRLSYPLFAGAVLLYMLSLLIVPAQYADAVRKSIAGCLQNVVPSLFLFMAATQICMEYGILARLSRPFAKVMRIFRLPPAAFEALLIGGAAGFPMGARVACRLYADGRLSREQAERLLAFCNNCGPAFLIGAVGSAIWGDAGLGALLWAVQFFAAVATGLLFRGRRTAGPALPAAPKAAATEDANEKHFAAVFVSAVKNAAVSVLFVCAFIVFMSGASVILRFSGFSTRLGVFEGALLGVFEITSGIGAIAGRGPLPFAVACFCAGFGGLSVHCQTLLFTEQARLGCGKYFLGKTVQGLLCFPLGCGAYRLFRGNASAAFAPGLPVAPAPLPQILITLAAAAAALLLLRRLLFSQK